MRALHRSVVARSVPRPALAVSIAQTSGHLAGPIYDAISKGTFTVRIGREKASGTRPIHSLAVRRLAVGWKPVSRERYRATAWRDTRTFLRCWVGVGAVAAMTVSASVAAVFAADASPAVKVLLAALGAGAGFLILGGAVFLASLFAAPYRQRNEAWKQVDKRQDRLAKATSEAESRETALREEVKRVSHVTADIDHRHGCPRAPARLESYAKTREDGIPVMVGHCTECGACAYRHGDVSVAPPSPHAERDRTPTEELSTILGEARALRARLLVEEPGHWGEDGDFVAHDPLPTSEDRLYLWARRALKVLADHFPEHADAFYGEDVSMANGYFMMAFQAETRMGRQAFLERRIAVLARALERAR